MNTTTLRILLFSSIISCISCTNSSKEEPLRIQAQSIDAKKEGDLLVGSSVLNDPNYFVWGGSVVEGDDGKYHMFYSLWESGESYPVFSDGWLLHSKIAYAVSDYPDRDFKFQKIILKGRGQEGHPEAWDAQSTHNPHIKKFNDHYYLYYTGSRDPGVQEEGSPGAELSKRNRVQQSQQIGVIEFKSFEDLLAGNFKRPNQPLLSPRTRVKPDHIVAPSPKGTLSKPDNIIVVNPSVVQRPSDGKFLLYFKGNQYDPHWRGVHGVAISDSPLGPFLATDTIVFEIKNDDGKIASAEDPYVWYHHSKKKFYAVFKDFTGKITGEEPGLAILESIDGIQWEKPEHSFMMKKEVLLKSGERIKAHRLERPQFLIDEKGNPKVIYCAVSIIKVSPTRGGASFNVQIPLTTN